MSSSTEDRADIVRRDFIEAYTARWSCPEKYAESLMEHVETGAKEDALADFYQQLCHMHTGTLLMHGGQVAQGLALAIGAVVELIPVEKRQAATGQFVETAKIQETG